MAAPKLGLTGYIIAAQGIFGIVNGSVSLLSISAARSNADMLGIPSIAGVHAIALGSLSIGYVQYMFDFLSLASFVCRAVGEEEKKKE